MPRTVIDLSTPQYQFKDEPLISDTVFDAAMQLAGLPATMRQERRQQQMLEMQQRDHEDARQMHLLQMEGMRLDQAHKPKLWEAEQRRQDLADQEQAIRLSEAKHAQTMRPILEARHTAGTTGIAPSIAGQNRGPALSLEDQVQMSLADQFKMKQARDEEAASARSADYRAQAFERGMKPFGFGGAGAGSNKPTGPVLKAAHDMAVDASVEQGASHYNDRGKLVVDDPEAHAEIVKAHYEAHGIRAPEAHVTVVSPEDMKAAEGAADEYSKGTPDGWFSPGKPAGNAGVFDSVNPQARDRVLKKRGIMLQGPMRPGAAPAPQMRITNAPDEVETANPSLLNRGLDVGMQMLTNPASPWGVGTAAGNKLAEYLGISAPSVAPTVAPRATRKGVYDGISQQIPRT